MFLECGRKWSSMSYSTINLLGAPQVRCFIGMCSSQDCVVVLRISFSKCLHMFAISGSNSRSLAFCASQNLSNSKSYQQQAKMNNTGFRKQSFIVYRVLFSSLPNPCIVPSFDLDANQQSIPVFRCCTQDWEVPKASRRTIAFFLM